MSKKRMVQLFGLVAAVGAIAGVVVATAGVGRTKAATPSASALNEAIASAPSVTVATFGSSAAQNAAANSNSATHVVAIQRLTGLNLVCVWDKASDGSERGGGCNDASDPLNGQMLSVTTTSSTGANGAGYASIRIAGLAAASVTNIAVKMSDGSTRPIELQTDVPSAVSGGPPSAFAYAEGSSDLAARLRPATVIAFNAAGRQVGSAPVGLVN